MTGHIQINGNTAESLINFRGPLIRDLLALGLKVSCTAYHEKESTPCRLREIGVDYYPINLSRRGTNPLSDMLYFLQLRRITRALLPDVVFSYAIKPSIYGSLAAARPLDQRSFSLISGAGGSFENSSLKDNLVFKLVSSLLRMSLRKNHRVFFQNPDDAAQFQDLQIVSERQSRVVNGSGVDLSHFQSSPPPHNGHFLLIARMIPAKGVSTFVEAIQSIRKEFPSVKGHLVGPLENPPHGYTIKDLGRWTSSGAVQYHGETSDVRPFLEQAMAFVLPSYYREGQPRSILEAMATGRPIITTDSPGCRETIFTAEEGSNQSKMKGLTTGTNGFLVEPKNVAALSEAMRRLVLSPSLTSRMARESLLLARSRYDAKLVNAELLREMSLF